ncbi:MAG TPA: PIG-L family deacetylase [Acidobacteriaceae bacterium]|nr:PIG-L family deacetylase [Acidobacteriaceae bacterium]
MHRSAPVALATILAATAPARAQAQNGTQRRAQAPTPFSVPQSTGKFTDPANLAGERVRPRNGRELPIDGGLGTDGKPDNALGLAQMLRKLNTRASLMLIVAHPDDEDGGMLTYYSRGLGARVAVLTLTRGEGGQNQMTGDFEDALGLLRTQELLSADRYMGVDQFFGTEVDFGFTKTKAEAFQKWNHERVLYDAVRAVRIFRPLVIAAVFSGAVTDGHGQHQVSGQIAQEVFKAAGDPDVFPELTREGILPWQPLKVYARVPFSRVTPQGLYDYATGQTVPAEFTNYVTGQKFSTEPTADVTINEGASDPLLTTCAANQSDLPRSLSLLSSREAGSASSSNAPNCHPLSYVQFARIGLGLQRSQIGGGDRISRAGRVDVGYHLYGSRVCAPGLPNPTPNLCNSKSTAAANKHDDGNHHEAGNNPKTGWPTLSHSERVGYRAVREKTPSPRLEPTSFTTTSSDSPALTTRNSVILSAASHTQPAKLKSVILSDRSEAKGAEEPRGSSPNEYSSTLFNPELSTAPSFFDGIDTSIEGIATLMPGAPPTVTESLRGVAAKIAEAQHLFNPTHPERIAPLLAEAETQLIAVLAQLETQHAMLETQESEGFHSQKRSLEKEQLESALHELRVKSVQLNEALRLSLGLELDATDSANRSDLPTETVTSINATASLSTPTPATFFGVSIENSNGKEIGNSTHELHPRGIPLRENSPLSKHLSLAADATREITRPYFSRPNIEQPFYDLHNSSLRNAPVTQPAFVAYAAVGYENQIVQLARVVHSGPQPVQIIPPVSLTLDRNAQVVPDGTRSLNIDVHTETEDHPQGELRLHAPQNWTIRLPQRTLRAGTETFPASLPAHPQAATLKAEAIISGTTYTEGFRPVGYGSLPRTNYYTPATLRVVPVDLKLPPENKRRIGYLPGTGDDVPAALASIGLTPTILKVSDLTPEKLKAFDTVVLGVRTYNAHPDLHGAPTQALLNFASNGGNVVVQYQTPEFTAADAPFPLTTHNERVIDETAPVKLLDPGSPLLTTPNKITEADFNNWIEERGHGFLDTWDPHYTALTETHDPGAPAEHILPQAPQRGGLITTQLGKGRWTYCAFALYRQLPEAVPGAFRLFVNLLNP